MFLPEQAESGRTAAVPNASFYHNGPGWGYAKPCGNSAGSRWAGLSVSVPVSITPP